MEEFAVMEAWSEYGSEDELVRELLDDESPFFVLTESRTESEITPSNGEAINKLISTAYSGPTIDDFETALSATAPKDLTQDASPSGFSMLERGLNKIEHKYTLKIKSCGNMVADDGYKWRKYGQKSIKNSPNPRSYYRCTNPRCSAKKQVERSSEDADTLVITYEGLHLHFAYPYFFMGQAHQDQPTQFKRPKTASGEFQNLQETSSTPPDLPRGTFDDHPNEITEEGMGPQGLLEDMVPLTIRNPSRTKSYSSATSSPSPLLILDIKATRLGHFT